MSMNIHIIKKKILNLINASMNIKRKTYCALNRISFLKHITREPPEWPTYYVNINFNVCLTYFIYINEHVHMLGKKTGVLFTISSVNFELKQGNEYRSLQLLRILSEPSLSLSLYESR